LRHRGAAHAAAARADRRAGDRSPRHGLGEPRRDGGARRRPSGAIPMTAPVRAYWQHRSPLEGALLPEVSADRLMTHVRTMGAWERESGSPGEARAYDYIEGCLREAGLEIERSQIEALISLPEVGRLALPDGSAIEGLAHAFSPSVEGLDAEVVDAGEGSAEDYARVSAAGKIVLLQGLATPGRAWAAQAAGTVGQIFVNLDHLHNMIVTTVWGTP